LAGAVVIAYGRVGPDWAAQEYRSWFARNIGLRVWNDAWYAGHALPSYSVLYPPVAALLGAGLTGLGSATALAWAGCRLMDSPVRGPASRRGRVLVAQLVLAICVLSSLVIGQVPFLLGAASGAIAILGVRDRHRWIALIAAVACSLASPLAGVFLACIAAGWLPTVGWRRVLPLSGVLVGGVATTVFGGNPGTFPFDAFSAVPFAIFALLVLLLAPRRLRTVRLSVAWCAAVAAILVAVPNAVGANIIRLPQLAALPLAAWVIADPASSGWIRGRARRLGVFFAMVAAGVWLFVPVVSAVARGSADPSNEKSYYAGLLRFLATQDATNGRLEIPFTREHWEAAYVAPTFPIARGWERQLDVAYNAELYRPLSADVYRAWLDETGVRLVAIPDVPLDYGGVAERELLSDPPAYLQLRYADQHWRVYEVSDPTPMITGPATLDAMGPTTLTIQFHEPGTATVKVHASPFWTVDDGGACIASTPSSWLVVTASRAQTVTVESRISPASLLGQSPSACDRDGD